MPSHLRGRPSPTVPAPGSSQLSMRPSATGLDLCRPRSRPRRCAAGQEGLVGLAARWKCWREDGAKERAIRELRDRPGQHALSQDLAKGAVLILGSRDLCCCVQSAHEDAWGENSHPACRVTFVGRAGGAVGGFAVIFDRGGEKMHIHPRLQSVPTAAAATGPSCRHGMSLTAIPWDGDSLASALDGRVTTSPPRI